MPRPLSIRVDTLLRASRQRGLFFKLRDARPEDTTRDKATEPAAKTSALEVVEKGQAARPRYALRFRDDNWFHSRGALHTSWESRTQTKLEGGGSRRYRQIHVAIVISRYPCMEEAVGPLSSESRSPSPMAPSPRTWRCQSTSVL